MLVYTKYIRRCYFSEIVTQETCVEEASKYFVNFVPKEYADLSRQCTRTAETTFRAASVSGWGGRHDKMSINKQCIAAAAAAMLTRTIITGDMHFISVCLKLAHNGSYCAP